jgi:hypothetical protein
VTLWRKAKLWSGSWSSFSCEWKGCDGAVQSVRRLGSSRLFKGVCCWC